MPQAVVYVRVSSDEQVKGMSLDFQKADCRVYAAKRGLEINRLFEERGESAKFADRPELEGLLNHCRKSRGMISAVIVWKLDRLSRNQLDYYYLKRILLELGIAIHSATEPSVDDANSISGKVFETFSALQAEIDNTIRGERTRRGMAAKIAAGIHPWAAPLGYRRNSSRQPGEKKTQPDEVDPSLFPILQAGLRRYACGGVSQSGLQKVLDEHGFAHMRGRRTRPQFINELLYERLDFYRGWLSNPWTGESFRGAHQPMITEEEYLRIVAIRDGRSVGLGTKRRHLNPLFPLRGTIKCAQCDRHFTASVSRGRNAKFAYYHCATKGCPTYGKGVPKDVVEEQFGAFAAEHALNAEFLDALAGVLTQVAEESGKEVKEKAGRLDRQIADLEAKRLRVYEMREDGTYTKEEFSERRQTLESEANALKLERLDLGSPEADVTKFTQYATDLAKRLEEGWAVMSFESQQRFQKILLPEGISYDRKCGFGTAILGPIFGLNSRFREDKSAWVAPARFGWNRIVEDLARLAHFCN